MKPLKFFDNMLNSVTMYRLLVYGLSGLIAIAVVFSFTGVLSLSGPGLLVSVVILASVCYLSNKLMSYTLSAPVNTESYLITALILVCILPPATTAERAAYIALAGVVAMVSKFIMSYRHVHIFNPAAFAAAAVSLLGLLPVTWWIGRPALLPFTTLFGVFLLRKIHRFTMFFVFAAVTMAVLAVVAFSTGQEVLVLIKNAWLSGPLVFFGTVMLTEPATMPALRYYHVLYAVIVGGLYSAQARIGIFSTSPHMVLLAGNIFAYAVNPRVHRLLTFKERIRISDKVYDYVFTPNQPFQFIPGQYMEWTLPHQHVDTRGNRRTFTIASSPTEKEVHLGVKFYEPSSTFKRFLKDMAPGHTLVMSHIAGSFVLPHDRSEKLVLIAGGIGITPFRSQLKYLLDTKQKRDIVLLYFVNTADELAYKEVFRDAKKAGVTFVPVVGALLEKKLLEKAVPDYKDRMHYISGPNGLVDSYKHLLRQAGVPKRRIITDYFPGY